MIGTNILFLNLILRIPLCVTSWETLLYPFETGRFNSQKVTYYFIEVLHAMQYTLRGEKKRIFSFEDCSYVPLGRSNGCHHVQKRQIIITQKHSFHFIRMCVCERERVIGCVISQEVT